jgi:hypothetical protein
MTVSPSLAPSPDGNLPVHWQRRWLGSWPYWGYQLAGWGGFAVSSIGLTIAFRGRIEPDRFQYALVNSAIGLGVSHLLRILLLLFRARWAGWRLVGGTALAVLLGTAGMTGPLIAVRVEGVMASPRPPPYRAFYLDMLYGQFPLLLGWVAVYYAITNNRDYRRSLDERLRLEAAVKDAELRVLKAQINPHFLFNCLNSTWAMIPKELERPRESLTLLADLLRAALTLGEKKTVSFRQEWETVQTYLALERIRFEQRLRVQHAIDPATAEWPVPPFLLQTLVENAVKFGVRPRDEGGDIGIEAFVREATLHFRVTNPGRLAAATQSTGVGLKNSRDRLRHLFGDAATLTLTQATGDCVVAEVTIQAPATPSSNRLP